MEEKDIRTIESAVTVELHGYLAGLKLRPLTEADLPAQGLPVERLIFEMGIPVAAVERVVVGESLVSKKYPVKAGDKVTLFPLELDQ